MKKNTPDIFEQIHEQCNLLARQNSFLNLAKELINSLNTFLDINYFSFLLRKEGPLLSKAIDRNHIIIGHNTLFHNAIWKIIQNGIIRSFNDLEVSEEDILKDFLDVTVDVVNLGANKPVKQDTDNNHILYSVPLSLKGTVIGVLVLIDEKERDLSERELQIIEFFSKQFLLIFENRLLAQGLKEISLTDDLTETLNRRYFIERFKKEFSRAKRFYTPLSLMIIEVRNLKKINDTHGHQFGDRLLTHLAGILKRTIRSIDLVGRNSGTAFILLLPHTKSDGTMSVIKRIKNQIHNNSVKILNTDIELDLVYGVSSFPDNSALDPDEFVKSAEDAIKQAKQIGSDSLYIFSRDSLTSLS